MWSICYKVKVMSYLQKYFYCYYYYYTQMCSPDRRNNNNNTSQLGRNFRGYYCYYEDIDGVGIFYELVVISGK